jgi:hypothetical protein
LSSRLVCAHTFILLTFFVSGQGLPDDVGKFGQIWANFGGPWNGKGWYILGPFGINYGLLVYFTNFHLVI